MPLDAGAQAVLDLLGAHPRLHTLPVPQAREFALQFARSLGPGEPVGNVVDSTIPLEGRELAIRAYTPVGAGPFPIYVYFHGGGWVIGDLDTEDAALRAMCNTAQCLVVSVNFRHAPEHKFPAAVDDAYEATRWIAAHGSALGGDTSRIAVGGTSAGGNLAAVVCQLAREANSPRILKQILITPVLDCSDSPSRRECAVGYGLERVTMDWFQDQYWRTPTDGLDPRASPLRATDLSGLPEALILTAEFDPLRDEGQTYAERLRAAGVPVAYRCLSRMIHLYLGPEALATVAAHLREAFAR